jgi:hypothetical protein
VINQKSPILGTVEKVKELNTDTSRRFDLETKQWGAIKNEVTK